MDRTAAGNIIQFEPSPNDTLKIGGYKFPKNTKVSLTNSKMFSESMPIGPTVKGVKLGLLSVDTIVGYGNWKITIDANYIPEFANEALVYKQIKQLNVLYKNPSVLPVVNKKMNTLGILAVWIRSLEFPNQDLIWELPFKMECSSFVT